MGLTTDPIWFTARVCTVYLIQFQQLIDCRRACVRSVIYWWMGPPYYFPTICACVCVGMEREKSISSSIMLFMLKIWYASEVKKGLRNICESDQITDELFGFQFWGIQWCLYGNEYLSNSFINKEIDLDTANECITGISIWIELLCFRKGNPNCVIFFGCIYVNS